ncbi:MAG: YaaA family protein [Acidaminobacteraceae bacterium]
MKILLSPSKTQDFSNPLAIGENKPVHDNVTKKIHNYLKKMDLSEILSAYKISEKLALEVESMIKSYKKSDFSEAISAYTGSVYREIKVESYSKEEMEFLQNNIRILSSFYGVLKPLDLIRPYRLDMKTKLKELDIKSIWSEIYSSEFQNEDLVVNLASKEFSSLIRLDIVNVEFKDYSVDKYLVKATYAKTARGKMVNEIVKSKCRNIEDIKSIVVDNYIYNESVSQKNNLVFTRGKI